MGFLLLFLPCHLVLWMEHNALLKPRPPGFAFDSLATFFPRLCEPGPCSLISKIVRASFWLYMNHTLLPGCCLHLNLITPAIWLILLALPIL